MDALDLVVTLSTAASTMTTTPTAAAAAAATTHAPLSPRRVNCEAVNLPVGGVIIIPGSDPITLTASAAFRAPCLATNTPNIFSSSATNTTSVGTSTNTTTGLSTEVDTTGRTADDATTPQLSDFRDPFYASTFPQCYALSATTVISYTLVIMLMVAPRSFLDGGVVVLGRRGFTNGGSGGKNIGGRPWLQKVAALTVAISLTIATADTFRVAKNQYSWGIQNAEEMQEEVMDGTELKVIRIISDTFLWLAQAQTLIRLFPRQREKVIIKWTAFSLILLDLIFDSLNSFRYSSSGRTFTDAVPALSYLFQLALGVLYAAWVIYYSLMKKRYAFYHPKMRNICLVATLSLLAILVPIVFFVLDISKPDFAAWGDYVRWVGAAAASVIVWEWVERIEALEREEKKDGILGREVFDGDEMLDIMPSDFAWPRRRRKANKSFKDDDESSRGGHALSLSAHSSGRKQMWPGMTTFAHRYWPRPRRLERSGENDAGLREPTNGRYGGDDTDDDGNIENTNNGASGGGGDSAATQHLQPPLWPARPAPAATPISRTDTASADSTIYVMRYHPVADGNASQTTSEAQPSSGTSMAAGVRVHPHMAAALSRSSSGASSARPERGPGTATSSASSQITSVGKRGSTFEVLEATRTAPFSRKPWRTITKSLPFHRGTAPGPENSEAGTSQSSGSTIGGSHKPEDIPRDEAGRWDIRGRLEEFAVTQAEKLREKIRPSIDTTGLPVMVIPAPNRQGLLARVLEEEENNSQQQQLSPGSGQLQRNESSASAMPGILMGSSASRGTAPALRRSSTSDASVSSASADSPRSGPGPIPQARSSRDGPPTVVAAALSRASSDREPPSPKP
ncbi:pH signal transduction protein [Grosmannia clavigera kw1407]|uniref:pH signal transduction protein n=1 Tax=Grosmannia clavigera (strain kw1407 / UAMH 11150) TaxID=655863 RepID=F0XPW7_GROCL|nr:pH signal transduction protein [Grosmannia clavigera kw1407]EFX00239.1 pH signal transduction protein [Grosmannia clavigera kw1407]